MKIDSAKIRISTITTLLVLLEGLCLFCGQAGAETVERRVLLLHSYHSGYSWTDRITAEVKRVFEGADERVTLFVEYMDTKRTLIDEGFAEFADLMQARFAKAPPDVLLCADDMALQFIEDYRERLFPDVPVVFCGISSPRTLFPEQPSYMTGVLEDYDLEKTIDLALRLFPRTRRLAVVSDPTHLGILAWEKLQAMASRLAWQVEIIPLVHLPYPLLLQRVAALPDDAVILFLTYFLDSRGRRFNDLSEVVREVHGRSSVPIFTPWSFLIHQDGALGGFVVSPESQGKMAAGRVLRILAGEKPGDMPILWESPKVTMVQYSELQRFGIPSDALPKGTVVKGIPQSLFGQYREMILLGAGAFVLLCVAVVFLAHNVWRRRDAERRLRHQLQFLDLLIDTVPFPLFFRDSEGRYELVNRAFVRLAGKSREEVRGKTREDIFGESPKGLIFQTEGQLKDTSDDGRGVDLSILEPQGRRYYNLVSREIALAGTWAGDVGLVIDITERKKLEDDLRTREERLKLALEGGATGTWDWDIPTDVVTLTGAWVARFGRRREDHQTDLKGWLSLIHPEEAPLVERALHEVCRGADRVFSEEHRIEVGENEWNWVLDKGRVVARDETGRPLRFSGVLTDISEHKEVERRRRELEGELRKAATTDRLTGVLNRQYFENLLALQISRSGTDGSPLSLILFDIDDFKSVNDTYGHLSGDRVLVSLCQTVKDHIRKQDYFGRWGGEEFTLLILGGEESTLRVAEKIRIMVEEKDHGIPEKVTISVGVSTFRKGDRVENLVGRADERLYRAKSKGKNRVEGPENSFRDLQDGEG